MVVGTIELETSGMFWIHDSICKLSRVIGFKWFLVVFRTMMLWDERYHHHMASSSHHGQKKPPHQATIHRLLRHHLHRPPFLPPRHPPHPP